MYNDSIETLLLRHYGQRAPVPAALEQQLMNSVLRTRFQQGQAKNELSAYCLNRRRTVKLVALASAGIGLLGASLEVLDAVLIGQPASQSVLS